MQKSVTNNNLNMAWQSRHARS